MTIIKSFLEDTYGRFFEREALAGVYARKVAQEQARPGDCIVKATPGPSALFAQDGRWDGFDVEDRLAHNGALVTIGKYPRTMQRSRLARFSQFS